MGIVLKSERELAKMREAGLIVRAVLDAVEAACVPGVNTAELNAIAKRELRRAKASSAFLGYAPGGAPPYPAVLCTSVNAVVVHGIPDRRQVLHEGDVVGIDFACYKDGYCADAARTVAVGIVSAPRRRSGAPRRLDGRHCRREPLGARRAHGSGDRRRAASAHCRLTRSRSVQPVPRGRAAILSTEAKVSSLRFLSQQRDEGVEALAATAAAPMGAGAEKRLVDGIFLIGHF